MIKDSARSQVIYWLATGCFLIFLMVLVGGITRLTDSGLSMVDWKLISGSVPPMNQEEWEKSFEAYQQFPEFEIQPEGFTLSDYKSIFWWEYLHRVLGRLIGIVFLLPFLFFVFTKRISGKFLWKTSFLFLLGGLQGFFGWYMVKSGLVDNPHVSHYRLALHLVTAFLTFSYTFWLILEILYPKNSAYANKGMKNLTITFMILLIVQIIYGAFVAGMKAGLFYNTWPLMEGKWIADGVTALSPFYLNLIETVAGVQFVHRSFAMVVLLFGLYFLWKSTKIDGLLEFKMAAKGITILLLVQIVLGILTLIWALPLSLALAHQIVAFFILMSLLYALRVVSYQS